MPNRTHGDSYTSEYGIWRQMRSRCRSKTNPAYRNYGARGITVCARWNVYECFLEDMGRRPSPKHTIERRNNDQGYSKANCKWASRTEQLQNKRNTRYVMFRGALTRLHEVARILGRHVGTIAYRAAHGKPLDGENYVRN